MTRIFPVVTGVVLVGAMLTAQGPQAADVLRAAREALGGETKLAAVKTVAATGRTRATTPSGQIEEMDFAVSIELPDKFMKREVLMAMGPTSVYRHSGFNGAALINEIDSPPMLSGGGGPGGGMWIRRIETGPSSEGRVPSPEEVAANNQRLLAQARQSFARLTLGMFATSFSAYPLTFTYGGQAESPDGKADVIDVSDGDGFKARLFIDAASHLPLMLTWMDREPIRIEVDDSGSGENVRVIRRGGPGPGPSGARQAPAGPDPALTERLREAEANRRTVEFRSFYSDYRHVDGVKMPMRIVRTIDGRQADEVVFDRIRLNSRIDPKTFTPTKK